MADGLTLSGLRDAYAAASTARKLLWGLVFLFILTLPLALVWQDAQTPEKYSTLYSRLSDRDGGEVVEALEALKIPYRLSDVDGAVQVPQSQLYVARYKLAAQGLPRGDKPADEEGPRFGLSSFQEQLGYQRGLEARLASSVQTIEAVESARVHLALPRQSTFLREQIPPAASVLVKLKPGLQLSEEQVEALRQIVAGGVPAMSPGQVSIIDQSGAMLAAGVAEFYRGLSANQLEYARRLESDLADRISRVLEPVLGKVAFKVQVTARINFAETEETTENAYRTGTIAGTVDRTVRHVREPRGRLQRVSVLVVVDERAGPEVAKLDRLAALARQAIGFDNRRGDNLQVIMLPFPAAASSSTPSEAVAPAQRLPLVSEPQTPDFREDLLPVYAGLALSLVLLVLLWWVRQYRRRQEAEMQEEAVPEESLEARLVTLRQQVIEDPKVAASVVKLWIRST